MRKVLRAIVWLGVLLLLLSPVLWLGWKYREHLEDLFFGPTEPQSYTQEVAPAPDRVTALGRIEPADGVVRIAGPARFSVVVDELLVDRGDTVAKGELVATLESIGVERAEVVRLRAELAHAEVELGRSTRLVEERVLPEADLDRVRAERDMVAASLDRAVAELARSHVRSPINGVVMEVTTRSGERVGEHGIVEVADTSAMVAVAEVYETEIGRVAIGQRATVQSAAFPERELEGTVARIALKVSRKDVLDSDPVADADSRVVEVEIRLEDPRAAAALTNLRVEVIIDTAP